MPVPEVVDETDDPFEAFNRAMGAGAVTDPYPGFVELRAEGPMVQTEFFGPPRPRACPTCSRPSRYEAVQEVLRDGVRFSSSGYAEVMGAVMGHTILEMDEPEHHAYRSLIQQAFTRKAMERGRPSSSVPIVDELDRRFVDDGRAELVSKLFFPFPVNVIAGLLGPAAARPAAVPPPDRRAHQRVASTWTSALRASQGLAEYLTPIIHERRADPGRGHDLGASPTPSTTATRLDRRGDHRLLPAAAAGRRRDDLPLVVEPAVPGCSPIPTSSTPCAPTGRCCRRPSRRGCGGSRRC